MSILSKGIFSLYKKLVIYVHCIALANPLAHIEITLVDEIYQLANS